MNVDYDYGEISGLIVIRELYSRSSLDTYVSSLQSLQDRWTWYAPGCPYTSVYCGHVYVAKDYNGGRNQVGYWKHLPPNRQDYWVKWPAGLAKLRNEVFSLLGDPRYGGALAGGDRNCLQANFNAYTGNRDDGRSDIDFHMDEPGIKGVYPRLPRYFGNKVLTLNMLGDGELRFLFEGTREEAARYKIPQEHRSSPVGVKLQPGDAVILSDLALTHYSHSPKRPTGREIRLSGNFRLVDANSRPKNRTTWTTILKTEEARRALLAPAPILS